MMLAVDTRSATVQLFKVTNIYFRAYIFIFESPEGCTEERRGGWTAEICNVHDYGDDRRRCNAGGRSADETAGEGRGDQADRFSLRVGNRNGNNSWNELFRDRRDLASNAV